MRLNQSGTLQVDNQSRDDTAPEPTWNVCHLVTPSDAYDGIINHLDSVHNPRGTGSLWFGSLVFTACAGNNVLTKHQFVFDFGLV